MARPIPHPIPENVKSLFWAKVEKRGSDECWLWSACRDRNGYGIMGIKRKAFLAHRISWAISYGHLPANLHVCHRCDNPSCVNPSHLFLGTQADNMADMFSKGRGRAVVPPDNRGFRNPMAKLTAEDVRAIRALAGTKTQREIGADFGVGQDQISRIIRGERWSGGA